MWKILTAWAAGIVAIITAATLIIATAGEVQTDQEAEVWRQGHVLTESEKFKAERVDRVQQMNIDIEYDLLDGSLLPEQNAFKQRPMSKNDAKVLCIQNDKC